MTTDGQRRSRAWEGKRLFLRTLGRLLAPLAIAVASGWVGRRVVAMVGAPPSAPCIVTANHTSYFDHFVLAVWLLRHGLPYPRFLSKAELFEHPVSALVNRLGGGIPLTRGGADTEALETAERVLGSGGVIVLYAEGSRSRDGRLRAPRRGLALLAERTGAPVRPVGLLGCRQVLPIGSRRVRRRRRVVLVAGEAVPAPLPGDRRGRQLLTEEVFRGLAGLTAQWPRFVDRPEFPELPAAPAGTRRSRLAHALVDRGLALGDAAAAESRFRRALRLARRERDPDAVLARARALGQLARRGGAVPVRALRARRALRLSWHAVRARPTDPLAWHVWAVAMGSVPRALGGDPGAEATGHHASVVCDPGRPRALLRVAESCFRAGATEEARRWAEHTLDARKLDRTDPAAIHRARTLLERIDDEARAG